MKQKPSRSPQSPEEKAARTRPITLEQWLQQPNEPATRRQVYLVAKMLATVAVQTEREQAKYRRWYRRLWAAVQRLFAPAQVQVAIGQERMEPASRSAAAVPEEGEDGADDPRPAELAAGKKSVVEGADTDGPPVTVIDRRGER